MGIDELRALLEGVREQRVPVDDAARKLSAPPIHDLGHSTLDTHRELRCGHPEVVYGAGKTPLQLVEISRALLEHSDRLLITRTSDEAAALLCSELPRAVHHPASGCITVEPDGTGEGEGLVLVVCAGTSDLPVAEEAAVTARMLGARVERLNDVGVAGLHRLLGRTELLREAHALVVVAGMEGALPSVVGGLVERPVIAVPTSVGYGASLGGIAALLAMLNSCASGISVVNIDNGFGAGYQAALINRTPSATKR
jgi:pyridinium-3,5-biscarboxylic acid mononucleotide synthase